MSGKMLSFDHEAPAQVGLTTNFEGMKMVGWNPALRRPFYNKKGIPCVNMMIGGRNRVVPIEALERRGYRSPVFNSTILRRDEWIEFDRAVQDVARLELSAWSDLAAQSTYAFNGYGKLVLESESVGDSGEALVDMDGTTEDRNDVPIRQPEGVPLPITHAGFQISARLLEVSRNNGPGQDTVRAEHATRRVIESVEKTTIGIELGVKYGTESRYSLNSQVYGYMTHPNRMTKTNLTTPTGSNPEATVADVLSMRQTLANAGFKGPYMIYHSNDWDYYLDNDYARLGGSNANMTLRDRLLKIGNIQDIRRLDMLQSTTRYANRVERLGTAHPFTMIMISFRKETCRAINGMNLTTVQWESQGGALVNFRVMCIWVPQIRSNIYNECGVLVATTS